MFGGVMDEKEQIHEAELLKLNCDKAHIKLQWQPTLHFEETVRMTVNWYRDYYENKSKSMQDITIAQIEEYRHLANKRKIEWAL